MLDYVPDRVLSRDPLRQAAIPSRLLKIPPKNWLPNDFTTWLMAITPGFLTTQAGA